MNCIKNICFPYPVIAHETIDSGTELQFSLGVIFKVCEGDLPEVHWSKRLELKVKDSMNRARGIVFFDQKLHTLIRLIIFQLVFIDDSKVRKKIRDCDIYRYIIVIQCFIVHYY